MESLSQKQRRFSKMLAEFITWCFANGYEIVIGEVQRTQAQADANAKSGAGISNSLHLICLAADLRLFIKDVYQTDSSAYQPLGVEWEKRGGSWGGRFSKPDGNHFSLEHNGVR